MRRSRYVRKRYPSEIVASGSLVGKWFVSACIAVSFIIAAAVMVPATLA